MGVPGFIAWIRKYCGNKQIIFDQLPNNCKILYIDGNCLIHPKCFEVIDKCNTKHNINKLEELMFRRITNYIKFLIDYSLPEICYFAVDGVAPLAKIIQQKKRRYKTVEDNKIKNKLKKQYNIKTHPEIWNNTVITPGTEFMEKLHQYLQNFFSKLSKSTGVYGKIKYVYSSYHTPGEGEHKIMEDIRKRILENNTDDIYVIYGLDADLCFLSLASRKNNIYLLREEFHFVQGKVIKREINDLETDITEEMRYISIDHVKECYNNKMEEIIFNKGCEDLVGIDYTNDFIMLCYLLGNDFLPHFPTIDIHKEGLTIIIDIYSDILIKFKKNLLNIGEKNEININEVFLLELFRELAEQEQNYFDYIVPKYLSQKDKRYYSQDFESQYERKLWEYENMFIRVDDKIKLGYGDKSEWKFRYYEYYYGVSENMDDHISEMVQKYLEGLVWVSRYYYYGCPGWEWQYPFLHSPFISDVYNYFRKNTSSINKIQFTGGRSLKPCVQLLCVIPSTYYNIVSTSYQTLMLSSKSPIIDLFPQKVSIDMINKDMQWMCLPMLPYLDIERIHQATKNIKLSREEEIRNSECTDLYF